MRRGERALQRSQFHRREFRVHEPFKKIKAMIFSHIFERPLLNDIND